MKFKTYFYHFTFLATAFLMLFCLRKIEALSLTIPGTYSVPILILVVTFFKNSFFKTQMQKHCKKIFWTLLTISLVSRTYWNFFSEAIQTSDAAWYLEQGINISHGKFLLYAGKQTGPSILAALGIILLPLPTTKAALFPLLLVTAFFPILIFYFLKTVTNIPTALIGMTIAVFWPEAFFYSNFITASVYQSFFILLGYIFWLFSINKNETLKSNFLWLWPLVGGIFMGIAQYMRPNTIIFVVGIAIVIAMEKTAIRKLLVLLVGFVTICLPIIFFNWSEYKIISISPSQNAGNSLVIGTNFASKGHYYENFNKEIDEELTQLITQNKISDSRDMINRSRAAKSLALKRILSDPFRFIDLAINYKWPVYWANSASLAWTFEGTEFETKTELINEASFFTERFHRILVFLTFLSLFIAFFRAENLFFIRTTPFIVGTLAIASVHLIAEVQSQYHVSVSSFFPICGALGFAYLDSFNIREKLFNLLKYAS